jgi:hypothetical protein
VVSVLWGSARIPARVWRASADQRQRQILWSLIPVFVGGLLGFADGLDGEPGAGFFITLGLAAGITLIGIGLALPENTRAFFGTLAVELAALVVWSYGVVAAVVTVWHS